MSRCNTKLFFGPMSTECIEAVFRYSSLHSVSLGLISSKNQIDYNRGYVNKWTTQEYVEFISVMKKKYTAANIILCRDHCGPGFNGRDDLEDVYQTILADLYFGFDLIHFDFCHYKGSEAEKLYETLKAIEFALKYNPDLLIEVGTEENAGVPAEDLYKLDLYTDFFQKYIPVDFYVVQTGSLVYDGRQVGVFNKKRVLRAKRLLQSKGILLKEHNADYLEDEEIIDRRVRVDAMNIAPEMGTIQTIALVDLIDQYFPDKKLKWKTQCVDSKKWMKWTENKNKAWILSGHYNFCGRAYQEVIESLNRKLDLTEYLIALLMERIDDYVGCFGT